MKKLEFLQDPEVEKFVQWLCERLPTFNFDLKIKNSARVPGGVCKTVCGFGGVVDEYKWLSSWEDEKSGHRIFSCNWASTRDRLYVLSSNLQFAIGEKSEERTFDACCRIFEWGGERNPRVGARKFLKEKLECSNLVDYLVATRQAFSLETADLGELASVERVNSMLTKVYALNAKDGLPIYDTRVAIAISGLVEIYRIDTTKAWIRVPDSISFPVPPEGAGTNRRRLKFLNANALAPKPEVIRYSFESSKLWASAKIRLGWIIEAVLERKPDLLADQQYSRHHAFEAALFTIGYDVRILKGMLP